MKKDLHFWTVKYWMNQPGQDHKAFVIWASPAFVVAARKAMAAMDESKVQEHARAIVIEADPSRADIITQVTDFLMFRKEVGLAHISVPGNACGLDLDFKSLDEYERSGFQLLPHNIDTANQQSTLFAIWLRWAKYVEIYAEVEARTPTPAPEAGQE